MAVAVAVAAWCASLGAVAAPSHFAAAPIRGPQVVLASTGGETNVGTQAPIRIQFTDPVQPDPEPVIITPPAAYVAVWSDDTVVIRPERLQPATTYEVLLSPGLRGRNGVAIEAPPTIQFTTVSPPRVSAAVPEQDPLRPDGSIRVSFDRPMDSTTVEQQFRLAPAGAGRFDWPDPQTLVFRADRLAWSTEYRLQLGGASLEGDPLVPLDWRFRTEAEPPPSPPPWPPLPVTGAGGGPPLVSPSGCGVLYSLGPQFTLTFDDWGTSEQADGILRALASFGVRAVFFPAGWWATQNPDLIARMRAEGHQVGNHSYSHPFLTALAPGQARWEVANGVAGSGLFRPPFGARNAYVDGLVCSLGYRTVLWTVDPSDYLCQPADVLADKVMAAARPGGIAVLHIKGCSTAWALPRMIRGLRARGLL